VMLLLRPASSFKTQLRTLSAVTRKKNTETTKQIMQIIAVQLSLLETTVRAAGRSACTHVPTRRHSVQTSETSMRWRAGANGSDCFSVGFTSALISGTPAGGTFNWTVMRRNMSKRLLEAGLVLGAPVAKACGVK